IKKEHTTESIQKLIQTRSVMDYTSDFRILAEELEWDERALIDRFKTGLKDNVKRELMRMTVLQDVTRLSLEEWIEYATRTDDILYATRIHKDAPTKGKAGSTTSTTSTQRVSEETIQRR